MGYVSWRGWCKIKVENPQIQKASLSLLFRPDWLQTAPLGFHICWGTWKRTKTLKWTNVGKESRKTKHSAGIEPTTFRLVAWWSNCCTSTTALTNLHFEKSKLPLIRQCLFFCLSNKLIRIIFAQCLVLLLLTQRPRVRFSATALRFINSAAAKNVDSGSFKMSNEPI